MEFIEVIEECLFANDDNDELELQYLGPNHLINWR